MKEDSSLVQAGYTKIYRTFIVMAVCFSINHGTVTAVLALASSQLSKKLAGFSLGTMYLAYTFTALLVAPALVNKLGAKRSLDLGLSAYCCYVGSFLIAILIPDLAWPACMLGSFIGGVAAGWIWTAQGKYFSQSAAMAARAKGESVEDINSEYAAIFGSLYVGLEVTMKGLGYLVPHYAGKDGNTLLYIVFTALACASAFGTVSLVKQLPKDENEEASTGPAGQREWRLLFDPKMASLGFFNIAFGFVSAFVNFYLNGSPAKGAVGKDGVSLLSSEIAIVATLVSLPFSWLAKRYSKLPLMILGCVSWIIVSLLVILQSEKSLVSWGWSLAILYALIGIGRSVFETTNKATYADMFASQKTSAFAILTVQSGGSAAAAFFVFPYFSGHVMGWIALGSAGVGIFGLLQAFLLHHSQSPGQASLNQPLQSGDVPPSDA